jgi:Spy/CpxP family protein refolding chaperone
MKESLMLRNLTIGLSVLVAFAFAASLQAQGPGGPGGPRGGRGMMGGGGYAMLLQNEKVQKDLELVDDQKDKLKKLGQETMESWRKKAGDMSGLSNEERMKKMGEVGREMQEETQKKVEEILLPHQVERAKQIHLQSQLEFAPGMALASPELVKDLGLTDDQQSKIKGINEEAMKAMREMWAGGRPNDDEDHEKRQKARQEMETKRKENNAKLMDVLTSEQKEKLEKMKGPKFDVSSLMQGPGGNRRGNRGGGNGGNNPPPPPVN